MVGLSILGVVVTTHSVLANDHPNDPQYNFEFIFERFWWAPAGRYWVTEGCSRPLWPVTYKYLWPMCFFSVLCNFLYLAYLYDDFVTCLFGFCIY